jgi:hypothetical protein
MHTHPLARRALAWAAALTLCATCACTAQAQPVAELRLMHANGKIKESVVRTLVNGAQGFRQSFFFEDGTLQREFEWAGGRLNGTARVFAPGQVLVKEAVFRNDRLVSYRGFANGRIATQIDADRRAILNRGVPVNVRWDKAYDVSSDGRLVGFTARGLIEKMSLSELPEQITQMLADLSTFYDSKGGTAVSQANDIVSCGNGRAGLVDDMNLKESTMRDAKAGGMRGVMPAGSQGTPTPLAQAQAAIANIRRGCSGSGAGPAGSVPGAPTSGNPNNSRNQQAEQALTTAIAACSAPGKGVVGGLSSGNLFAVGPLGPGTGFKSIPLDVIEEAIAAEAAEAGTIVNAGTAAATEGTALEVTVVEGLAADVATEGAVTAARAFVMTDVLAGANAVGVAAVAGWGIGTLIDRGSIGKAITRQVARAQEAFDSSYQARAAEAAKAQKAAAERDKAKDSSGKPVARPNPDDASRNPCGDLTGLKHFCTTTSWRPPSAAASNWACWPSPGLVVR